MSIIYEPKGKAREYSPLAANFYDGCDHGCLYCYAPRIRFKTREEYITVSARRNVLAELEKDCRAMAYSKRQVLFNFMGDPYCTANDTHKLTRAALNIMLEYKLPVAILTKGGTRAVQDFDLMKRFEDHIKIGATLTFSKANDSAKYEPGAASPEDRLAMLEEAKKQGIKTWASFEPVIDPHQAIDMIIRSLSFVDEYKIGKVNNYAGLDKKIDWTAFLLRVVDILRGGNKPFYIKYDLRVEAPSVKLYGNEVLPDEFVVKPFPHEDLFV
jgi:DNA repair photolyase